MQDRQLISGSSPFLVKWVMPILFYALGAIGLIFTIVKGEALVALWPIAFMAIFSIFHFTFFAKIQKVYLTKSGVIIIGKHGKEEFWPFAEISNIEYDYASTSTTAVLTHKDGKEVPFLPAGLGLPFATPSYIKEIKTQIAKAQQMNT